jgi:hypothetical protein
VETGIVILLNTSGTWGSTMLRDVLLDELCGVPDRDLSRDIADWRRSFEKGAQPLARAVQGRALNGEELAVFTGRFFHPAYDDFTVSRRDGDVWLDYGAFCARVRMMPDGAALACEDDPAPDWMELRAEEKRLLVETSDLPMRLPFTRIE